MHTFTTYYVLFSFRYESDAPFPQCLDFSLEHYTYVDDLIGQLCIPYIYCISRNLFICMFLRTNYPLS